MGEISAFFSNKKHTNKIGRGEADPVNRQSPESDNLSIAGSIAARCKRTSEKSLACSPKSPRDSLRIPGHGGRNGKTTAKPLGDDIGRPRTGTSEATTYFTWANSHRSTVERDSAGKRSLTPDSVRKALVETGIYRGLEVPHRRPSRNRRRCGAHTQGEYENGAAAPKIPSSEGPSTQRHEKHEARYHDRGVMAREDLDTCHDLYAHASVGDDLTKTTTPILKAMSGERPDEREVGEGEKEDELHVDRRQIARQAYINRKGQTLECLEPPPRPKPPKSTIVERLESQAELEPDSIPHPTCSGVNIEYQAPPQGEVGNVTFPHHFSNDSPGGISLEPIHSCPDPLVSDMSTVFSHSLSHQTEDRSTPLGSRLWHLNQYAASQPLGASCHHPSQSGQLGNNVDEVSGFESANITPGVIGHESMQDYIGRIEQEVLEGADSHGQGDRAPLGTCPDKECMSEDDFKGGKVGFFNDMSLNNLETPTVWEASRSPPKYDTYSQGHSFEYNPPAMVSLSHRGKSRTGVETGHQADEGSMSRFWRPNQYYYI